MPRLRAFRTRTRRLYTVGMALHDRCRHRDIVIEELRWTGTRQDVRCDDGLRGMTVTTGYLDEWCDPAPRTDWQRRATCAEASLERIMRLPIPAQAQEYADRVWDAIEPAAASGEERPA